jgi:hypothetical protein
MNAKVAVTITATGDTGKQLSGSDGGFVLNPLSPGPYTATVEAPSFSRTLSDVTVVAGDRAPVHVQLLCCQGERDRLRRGAGHRPFGARVAESDIKRRLDRAMGHLL